MFDKTCNRMNNWSCENPRALGDDVDRSNPQTIVLGQDKHTGMRFSWYISDDLRAKIEPLGCSQYKPGDFMAVGPWICNEITNEYNDDDNWADRRVPSCAWSRPRDGNDPDHSGGEEDMLGGETGNGKGKGTEGGKGKEKGKATDEGKGQGK
jgi:hypothetical protein